jgi:hypothetical protein
MESLFLCGAWESAVWYRYWRERRYRCYLALGIKGVNLHLREHDDFVREGSGHSGMSALIDLVARKPG